jgi:hypothetical protein
MYNIHQLFSLTEGENERRDAENAEKYREEKHINPVHYDIYIQFFLPQFLCVLRVSAFIPLRLIILNFTLYIALTNHYTSARCLINNKHERRVRDVGD